MLLDPATIIKGTESGTLVGFWQWAYSDILSNRNRSVFAEYIIASALELLSEARIEWDSKDLVYRGVYLEVKSAAYAQSWNQEKPSKISFDIAKKNAWDSNTDEKYKESIRASEIYVFCLYNPYNKNQIEILDVNNWSFFIVETKRLNSLFQDNKQISLSKVKEITLETKYNEIRKSIDTIISNFKET